MNHTYVFRWNGFEKVIELERELDPDVPAEIMIGQSLLDDPGLQLPIDMGVYLWQFTAVGKDDQGRILYDATGDPYEKMIRQIGVRELATTLIDK